MKAGVMVKEREVALAMADADAAERDIKRGMVHEENTASDASGRLVYLSQSTKLERFRGKPEKPTELKSRGVG